MRLNQHREKFWVDHIRAWRESGLTQMQYGARQGISQGSLRYWSWRIGKEAGDKKASRKKAGALNLVPVQVEPRVAVHGCVLRGANGWAVEFSSAPAAVYLAEVLGGLR